MTAHPRFRAVTWALIAIGVAAVLLLTARVLVVSGNTVDAIHQTQLNGSPTSKKLLRVLHRVKVVQEQFSDCVQPRGKCFHAARQRGSSTLTIALVGVACSAGYTDLPDRQRIEASLQCVSRWVSAHPQLQR